MKYQKYLIAGTLSAFGLLAAMPANASYMSDCDELISKWKTCNEAQQSCVTETQTIEKECKCHRLQQGEWKLVMAAVGKNGVCAPPWPDDIPDPSPPKPDPEVELGDPWHSDDEEKVDPKNKKGKPEPVITHGGERAPGEKAPNQRTDD